MTPSQKPPTSMRHGIWLQRWVWAHATSFLNDGRRGNHAIAAYFRRLYFSCQQPVDMNMIDVHQPADIDRVTFHRFTLNRRNIGTVVSALYGASSCMYKFGPDPLLASTDWWAFDTAAVRPSDVLLFSSGSGSDASVRRSVPSSAVYWLYYSGSTDERFGSPFPAADVPSLPGLAISQDGRHWARIEGDHHTGALLGVGEDDGDEPRGWEARCVAAPKVVLHAEGDLRMYYHSFDEMSQRHAIGLARSRDGVRWRKEGKVLEGGKAGSFDERGVRQGHVIRDRAARRYVMVYEGVDADGRVSIGMAVSEDGLKGWRRSSELPVLRSSDEDEGWDGTGVGSPCLVQMDGAYEWRLYYMGVGRDGEAAIGMAYSQGHGLQKFEKCDAVLM
uniref:Glycosyl hydrolase family 32 N-terminal domain-containing protein n=1 Tax=Oryza brachyantha TaxID=4533 RepID=J3MT86_ORYBR